MQADVMWGSRWSENSLAMARVYMEAVCRKQSLVCLAADRSTMAELEQLIDEVGPYIAALKTHVDLVDDWSPDAWSAFCSKAADADLLIFEDRKFADIGGISRKQMSGIYDIRSWADLVTAHLISGPDIVDGLQAGWSDVGRQGGVLLLAQMSSRGNLLVPDYTGNVVSVGKNHAGVFGFIGNGSRPEELELLRKAVGDGKLIWTPGVNLAVGDGEMGQRYGDPREAVLAGSDCIIVGSGIHKAADPAGQAKAYADASWNAFVERCE
ncbi:MAG: orotidine-5'-phosphate decarboxylase [Euryarchaeota archaeon]|jgi:orotidine 5'-phosphate decarboxylase subfamily 1|nr:orotidine-5'-phosphate decarboxylase [Euryarchaeota archaeon]MBT5595364.1 orotidine-5'-phosphate decarboxylase [Euryarchaeota archaeon]MBT5844070.1 orotidine-5'-phosphate decarboxylase [Euryarchaeota archaeon]MBT6640801.1 orotidine-5'-phosphate decarboxylase [Euryarchaeota archaeon]MBT6845487.1 orotidine-5'-phosphate decarboxylase [Euryarchaeota archaeon]